MNHTCKTLYNASFSLWQAVPETAGRRQAWRKKIGAGATALVCAALLSAPHTAHAAACPAAPGSCFHADVYDASVQGAITIAYSFYDNSVMQANISNALISGSNAFFYDASTLNASAANAVSGGEQSFSQTSTLNASAANAVSGGNQYFYQTSTLNASVANAISGGTVRLFGGVLGVQADNATTDGVTVQFAQSAGGVLRLNGHATTVGKIETFATAGSGGGATIENASATAGSLTVDQSDDTAYAGIIQDGAGGGALSIVKTGTGTLTLTGANTYSGGTTVKAGTLAVSGTGRINSGAMRVGDASGDDGTLTIEAGGQVGSSLSYIGNDPGSTGAVTITGAGSTWNVAGLLYAGAGTGTLTIEDGGALNSSDFAFIGYNGGVGTATVTGAGSTWTANRIYVGNAGTGTLDIADAGEVSNSNRAYIGNGGTGNGTVTVAGAGTTWTINNDLFVGSGSGGTGTLTIKNGGAVSYSSGYIGEGLGSIGTVTVTGAGSTLTTPFDLHVGYSGTGTLNIGNYDLSAPDVAGTVTANRLTTDASGAGTVNFNQTDAIAFATPIQGNIAVNQRGTGTTTFSGTKTYSGATTISGGTLSVNGSLTASAVTVNGGGTIGGTGTLGNGLTVNSGGFVAPGNSIGTLNVTGAYVLNSGATYTAELQNGGNVAGTDNDFIDVTGTATIESGATIHVTPLNAADKTTDPGYAVGTTYTILTASGGLTVNGSQTITDDYAYLDFNASSDANNYYLTSAQSRTSFRQPGMSQNQGGVADAVFALGAGNAVYDAALNLLTGETGPAFDALSGAQHAQATQLTALADRRFHNVLGERTGKVGAGGTAASEGLRGLAAGDAPARDGFWLRALAGDGRVKNDGNAAGMRHAGGGLALGADRQIDANRLAGVAVSYGTSRADSGGAGGGTLDVTSIQLAAYGRWQGERHYLDGSASVGRHRTKSRRDIAFMSQQARATYDTDSLTLNLEAGRPIARGPATLTPYAGIDGTMLRREGFAETGSAANLSAASRTEARWRSRLGARYAWSGARLQPTLDLAWVHAFGDAAAHVDARFAAAPAAPAFRVSGPALDRDRLSLGLGLTAWAGKHARLDLAYNGEFARTDRDQHVAATFRWVW